LPDVFLQPVGRPPLVGEEADGFPRQQPRNVQPEVRHGDFFQHRAQAGRMVGVRMRKQDMLESNRRSVMALEMCHDCVAGLGIASVDQHQLEVDRRAVAQDDGVAGLAAGADWHELYFADHLTPPSFGVV
jgi:hypothetical protein